MTLPKYQDLQTFMRGLRAVNEDAFLEEVPRDLTLRKRRPFPVRREKVSP